MEFLNTIKKKLIVSYYVSLVCSILFAVVVLIAMLKQGNGSLLFLGGGSVFILYYFVTTFPLLKENDFQAKPKDNSYTSGLKFAYYICLFNGCILAPVGVITFGAGLLGLAKIASDFTLIFLPLYGFVLSIYGVSIFYYPFKTDRMIGR